MSIEYREFVSFAPWVKRSVTPNEVKREKTRINGIIDNYTTCVDTLLFLFGVIGTHS